jgi:hypothetical protein
MESFGLDAHRGNSVWILDGFVWILVGWFLVGCLSLDRQHKPSPYSSLGTNIAIDFLINRGYFLKEILFGFV